MAADAPIHLSEVIRSYREERAVPDAFEDCLRRLEAEGFALVRDPSVSIPGVRWCAADFIVHYMAYALDDHLISEHEVNNILALKRIYGLDEGDLLALQRDGIADLLRMEMSKILADERVSDSEAAHQVNLQRVLGLGYDEYLRLTRESVRQIVDQMLDGAENKSEQQKNEIIRRLQALQTVLRIDKATMSAIWLD